MKGRAMNGKTTFALMLCPVLACGPESGGGPIPLRQDTTAVYAAEGPLITARKVNYQPGAVFLQGVEQVIVDSVTASGVVQPGDTLARLRDPLGVFTESRVEMDLARAVAQGATGVADSLRAILNSPPWITWALSPVEGELISVRHRALLSPGDTLALLYTPADSLWVLVSPVSLGRWPPVPGMTIIESSLDTALARGTPIAENFTRPGTWVLPGATLREAGLRIFIMSASGDSIPVEILAETPGGALVYSEHSLDSLPLMPWGARRERNP